MGSFLEMCGLVSEFSPTLGWDLKSEFSSYQKSAPSTKKCKLPVLKSVAARILRFPLDIEPRTRLNLE